MVFIHKLFFYVSVFKMFKLGLYIFIGLLAIFISKAASGMYLKFTLGNNLICLRNLVF